MRMACTHAATKQMLGVCKQAHSQQFSKKTAVRDTVTAPDGRLKF